MTGAGRAWVLASVMVACAGQAPPIAQPVESAPLRTLDNTWWSWTRAQCDDGTHNLDARGFEDTLHITALGPGVRMTHTLKVATQGCAETIATWVSPDGASFSFKDQARISDGIDRDCGTTWPGDHTGELEHTGDELWLRQHRSPLCGGYDVRHLYRRLQAPTTDDHDRIRVFVTGLALRDADVMTGDFAPQGVLVVPKPATEGGGVLRWEGATAARGWLTNSVRSVGWIGVRLLAITDKQGGEYDVQVEYMDSALAHPMSLRMHFVIADGEIYEVQWLLPAEIPVADAPSAPLPDGAPLPDTAAP